MPGDVMQGCITNGGVRPNIIHAYTSGNWVVRANTQARLNELLGKVNACFEAAALATGAKLKITNTGAYKGSDSPRPSHSVLKSGSQMLTSSRSCAEPRARCILPEVFQRTLASICHPGGPGPRRNAGKNDGKY